MLNKVLACATLMPMLLACAPLAQADMRDMSPEQVSLVDNTCTQVMGLRKGEYYFALCHESLAHALANKAQGQEMAAAYKECRQHGLAEGTAAFSTCMLDSKATVSSPQPLTLAYAAAPGTEPGKSFYHMTPTEVWNHERYSCAQLGLVPGSAAFGECVANLVGALQSNPN